MTPPINIDLHNEVESYRLLIDAFPDGVIITDLEGHFLMINKVAVELYGYSSADELVGLNSMNLLTEESRARVEEAGLYIIKHGVGQIGEYTIVRPDGSFLEVETNSSIIKLGDKPIAFIAAMRNITIAKEQSSNLRESEEKYRSLVDESLQAVAVLQSDRYVYANQAFASIIGYTLDEVLALTPDQVWKNVHPDDMDILRSRNREISDEIPIMPRHRFRYISKDGSTKWVESIVRKMEYEGQPATQVVEIDITEQVEAEEGLRNSEERHRTIINSMQDIIFVYDKDNRYSQYYTSDKHLLYTNPDEFLGKNVDDVLPRNVAMRFVECMNKVRETGESVTLDYPLTINDREYWFSGIFTVHEDKESVVVVVRNISLRKETEIELRESEERFALFADTFPGPVFIKDHEMKMLFVNAFMRKTFDAEDWIGKTNYEVFPKELAEQMMESDKQVLLNKEIQVDVQNVPDKDGIEHIYRTYKFPISVQDGPTILGGVAVDITEIIRAEEALRQSEERYRLLFDEAPLAIVMTDLSGNFIATNRANIEMMGYSWEELRFINAETVYANPKDRVDVIQTLKDTGRLRSYEVELRRKNGVVFPTLLDELVLDIGGRDVVLAMIRDITEIKETTQALQESEERYRLLYENLSDGVFITDAIGNITMSNEQSIALFGYLPEEIIGKNFINFVHPDDRDWLLAAFRRAIESGEAIVEGLEVKGIKKDGSIIYFHVTNTVLHENGKYAGFQSLIRDVTSRHLAEEELRKSGQLLESIYNAIPNVVISTDAEFRIVTCNKAVERVLGYRPEELIGKNYSVLMPESIQDEQQARESELFAKGYLLHEDFTFRRKSGENFPASFSVALMRDEKGSISGMVGILRDETEREAAQREILSARDRSMLYLDLMTHDISNQMQAIHAGAQLAQEIDEGLELSRILALIEEAAEKCNSIISRVITTRRLSEAPLRVVSLTEELQSVITDFKTANPKAQYNIDLPKETANVQADEYLQTMILGVLENALNHNPMEESEKQVWVDVEEVADGYQITISDNGPGMSDKQKEWLFDMRRRYGGISLHLAKQIVEKHSGKIEVTDRVPGDHRQGASVIIWIPKSD